MRERVSSLKGIEDGWFGLMYCCYVLGYDFGVFINIYMIDFLYCVVSFLGFKFILKKLCFGIICGVCVGLVFCCEVIFSRFNFFYCIWFGFILSCLLSVLEGEDGDD